MKKTLNFVLYFLIGVSVYSNCPAMSAHFIEYLSKQSPDKVKYTTEELTDMINHPHPIGDENGLLEKEEKERIAKEKAAKEKRLKQEEEDRIAKKYTEVVRNEEKLNALFHEASSISNESSFEEISDYHNRIGYAIDHYEDGGERVIKHFLESLAVINSDDDNLLKYKCYGKVMLAMIDQVGERTDLFNKERLDDVLRNIPIKISVQEIHNNSNNVDGNITISLCVLLDKLNELSQERVSRQYLDDIGCKLGTHFKAGKKNASRSYYVRKIDRNNIADKIKIDKKFKEKILNIE